VAYRSKKIKASLGTEIVAPEKVVTGSERVRQALLDAVALPFVAVLPRRSVVIGGAEVDLDYGFRRWNWRSERALEIGLARRAMRNREPEDVLEVGNVLAFAGLSGHTVVDKYELGDGVLNVDIIEYRPTRRFGLVICISTLEHIGWDEIPRDPNKAAAAMRTMCDMGDSLLMTIPVGWHRQLEREFVAGPFDLIELAVKTSRLARWERRPLAVVNRIEYGRPYANGNAILIGSRH
jgi:hypothetical protein